MRRMWTTVALTLGALCVAPAVSQAATITLTDDAGAPVPLVNGLQVRNMAPDLTVTPAGSERYTLSVTGPNGAPAASPASCTTSTFPRTIEYSANGVYTVTLTTFTNTACTGGTTSTIAFSIAASVAVAPPTGAVLTRRPGSFVTIAYNVPFTPNPGVTLYQSFLAKGAVLGADGLTPVPGAKSLFPDTTKNVIPVRFESPGSYQIVARAQKGTAFSPWSAPIGVRVFAPFDFQGSPTFPDSRGPSYKLRVVLREKAAKGRVRIRIARGRSGGRFRSIGSARIRKGRFSKRFTLSRTGVYRLRYSYKGNALVAAGTVTQRVRITRRVFLPGATATSLD